MGGRPEFHNVLTSAQHPAWQWSCWFVGRLSALQMDRNRYGRIFELTPQMVQALAVGDPEY